MQFISKKYHQLNEISCLSQETVFLQSEGYGTQHMLCLLEFVIAHSSNTVCELASITIVQSHENTMVSQECVHD